MSQSLRTLGFSIFVLAVLTFSSTWAAEVLTPGDLNFDSVTNHDDFFKLLLDFDPSGPRLAPEADSNNDLRVDHKDVQAAILGRLLGKGAVNPPEPSQTGVVTGVLLKDVGDALVVIPIPGATVWISAEQGFRLKTTSGEGGDFCFEGVPAGTARVTASHPDYHKARAKVEVAAGEETSVTLWLASRNDNLVDLSGFVKGALSNDLTQTVPIQGAAVRIIPINDDGITGDFDPSHLPGEEDGHQVVFTDDQGHYAVHDLSEGKYRLVVSAKGYQSEERGIEILSNEKEHKEDFILLPVVRPFGAVAGTVYSYDPRSARPFDAPLPGARVVLRPAHADEVTASHLRHYEAISDGSGQYMIRGVLPGKYIARAVAAFHYPATAEIEVITQEKTIQDFHLEKILGTKGAVAGTVTGVTPGVENPVPLEDALVSLLPMCGEVTDSIPWADNLIDAVRVRSVTTDEEGKYTFRQVPAGDYMVIAWARGWGSATGAATVIPDVTAVVDLQIIHQPPPPQASLQGTIFGVVPETLGLPVPIVGARVIAIPANSDWLDNVSIPSGAEKDGNPGQVSPPIIKKYVTETDDNGHYQFASLPPGSYRVIAKADGYEPSEQMVELSSGVTTQLDFYLNAIPSGPGIVLGTVFTALSTSIHPLPIAGAKVRMRCVDDTSVLLAQFQTETNEEGYFEFAPVPVGTYKLEVSKEGFRTEHRRVLVTPGETVRLSIEMFPDQSGHVGALEGHVWEEIDANTDQVPTPIEGALVFAIPVSFPLPVSNTLSGLIEAKGDNDSIQCTPLITKTDERGYYRFDSVPAGTIAVVVLAKGYIPALDTTKVAAGEVTVLDFYLKPIGGGHDHSSLSGVITGHTDFPTFAPVYVAGAKVTLIPLDSTDPATARDVEGRKLITYTNQFGKYEFPCLSTGLYRMKVQADGYQDAEIKVEIPEKTAVHQDLELMPVESKRAKLFGYVTEPSTGGVAGPVADATVRLIPDDIPIPAIFPPPNVGYDRITDENGYYLFESLPAKGYHVVVLKDRYVPAMGHVDLQPGQELRADWTLTPFEPVPTARLFGYVTKANNDGSSSGIPIQGAEVRLSPEDPTTNPNYAPGDTDLIRKTDENGFYEFKGLKGSRYVAAASKDGYVFDVTHVQLADAEEKQLDFVLMPIHHAPATLMGVITEDVGMLTVWIPISGASITITNVNSEMPSRTTTSGPNGDYKFEDVPPGEYEISVAAEGYQSAEGSVHLPPGKTVIKNFALKPVPQETARLFGKVLEKGDNGELTPLAGATIFAVSQNVWNSFSTDVTRFEFPPPSNTGCKETSGEDGSYEFDALPPGIYWVFAWKDGYTKSHALIELEAGDQKEKNWKLSLISKTVQARLFGYVTENLPSGEVKPLANALVRLIPDDVAIIAIFPPPYTGYDRMTDENGYYEFDLLPVKGFHGVVILNGYTPEFFDGKLSEGEILQKDFTLEAVVNYAKIKVDVTQYALTLLPGRIPIAGAEIKLVESDGDIRTGQTNNEGYETFSQVTPGPYVISVTADEFVSQTHTGTVDPGAAITESFRLVREEQGPATLMGYVSRDMGPLDVWIPIEGALVTLAGVNMDGFLTTKTGEDGKYTFKDVSPRDYDVTVEKEGYLAETERVTLHPGEEKFLSFALEKKPENEFGAVSGTVSAVKPNGEAIPWPGLPVRLRATTSDAANDKVFERNTITDRNGTYHFDEIPPGEYQLKVTILFHDPLRETIEVIAGETTIQDFSFELMPDLVTTVE